MFTETIQEILTMLHRMFCWHKWKLVIRKDNGADFYMCEKCEYIKVF